MDRKIKIQFEELDFQNEAIDSIVDIFKGQPISKSNFTIENLARQTHMQQYETGVSNRLEIDLEDMTRNIQEIQLKNGLEQTQKLSKDSMNFSIEMETGERVIIVTGCIKTLISGVSGILNKYISCIA